MLLSFSLFFDIIFLIFSLILLIKNSPVKKANNLLGITFMLMAICGFWLTYLNYAMSQSKLEMLKYYFPVSLILVMFIGPFIYFYVRLLFNYQVKFRMFSVWGHSLPALPAVTYVIYFTILPINERINWLVNDYEKVRWQEYAINILFYIQLTIYVILCFFMVQKQIKKSRNIKFNSKLVDILWLRYFFAIALVGFIIKSVICTWINSDRVNTQIGLFYMDALFTYFFIQSVWKTGLFTQMYAEIPKSAVPTIKIADEVTDAYLQALMKVIERDKLYLSENCTIEEVAESICIPKHHLSHIINNKLNKGFADFMNEYRIRHACLLLVDDRWSHLTLEALGKECGFGSKTSFNRVFKKHTGSTPSEYKQLHGL